MLKSDCGRCLTCCREAAAATQGNDNLLENMLSTTTSLIAVKNQTCSTSTKEAIKFKNNHMQWQGKTTKVI